MKYRHRALESRLLKALGEAPVVFLSGPRQAGKSTLARHLAQAGWQADYVTLDDITMLAAAESDPQGFLRRFAGRAIVDEVQMAPGIFRALKLFVDELRASEGGDANGRFLLTGSANVMAIPSLSEALVGRVSILSLYPLSAIETLVKNEPTVNGLFDQDFGIGPNTKSKPDSPESLPLADWTALATFPQISGVTRQASTTWFDNYLSALLQRDIRQLAEIEKFPALPNIVKILATRAGGLLNDSDSARDAQLNAMTYRRYRILLQQLFLISLVPPWFRHAGKRLVKSPKLYFTDTALLAHQLGVEMGGLKRRDPGLFGRLLENFVASELIKQVSLISDGSLHHFRTQDGKEVDFVIERRNSALIGVEVKSKASVVESDFAGLKALKEQAGDDFRRGIVLYGGSAPVSFGDDMIALPLELLWKLNMSVTTDADIRKASGFEGYVFWADYGDRTRIRCVIGRETVDDYFFDNGSERQSLAAIKKHWNVIWPIFGSKISNGQIEVISHDHGQNMVVGRHQRIRQVTLEPVDFGFRDFRKRS